MRPAALEDIYVCPFACGDSLFLDVQGVGLMQLDPSEGLRLAGEIRKAVLSLGTAPLVGHACADPPQAS